MRDAKHLESAYAEQFVIVRAAVPVGAAPVAAVQQLLPPRLRPRHSAD